VAGGDATGSSGGKAVALANTFDYYDITITINLIDGTDSISEDDIVIDYFGVTQDGDYLKNITSGYPVLDETNFEITTECYLAAIDANGYNVDGIGTFNKDTTPMLQDIFKFTAFSKSSTDEIIFEIKNRISRR
jgi:hypothetical protein